MSGPGWYSFGRATHGELGRPSHTGPEGVENADVRPITIEGVEIETIACGHFHNIALSTEHQVFAWGANGHGQLGTERDGKTPAAAQQLQALLGDEQISHFCAGRNHSVFLSSTGRPFISGGLPAAEPGVSKVTSTQAVREISVTDGSEEPEGRLVAVAVGESQTFFLSSEGELWSWLGEEDRGERRRILGHFQRPTARAVLGLPRVAEVTCGLHHTLILTEERNIFSFGAGSLGQLGLGLCRRCPTPSQVMFPPQCDGCLCGIAAGFASSFAVTEQGWVYSWGCNEKCELGLGTSLRGAARPKPIDALYQVKVTQVAAGFAHTACVTDSGLLYLWGYGAYGQLGFGFDDLRSSMRLGNGWSACKASPGVQADDAGFTSTGQSQPWQQVWPRRCRRGPFRTRRCVRVECGAYHTIAQASKVLLGDDARNESEVLCPLPLEVSDLPAGTMALMEADQQWPPGAGLAECPRPVLRQKATRTVEIFRSLADLFWETKPCKTPLPETPSDVLPPQRHPVEGPRWRRALKAPVRGGDSVSLHPLQKLSSDHTSPRSPDKLVGLPLPGTSRVPMTTWTEVDEAVHKAFQRGDVSAPLPELLAELVEVSGPFKEPPGLPSSPSQGLARLECLTPRPFYLPEQEPDLTNISGAPVPIDAEDALNKPMIQGILPEVVGEINQAPPEEVEVAEKSPDHSAAKDEAENAAAVDGNEAEGDVEEVAEKNPEEFAARADEDAEASEVVEKDPSAAETATADVEVAEQTPDESAAAEDVVDVEVPVPPNGTAEDVEEEEKETQEVVKEEEEKEAQEVVKEEEEKETQEVVKEEEEKETQEVVKEEEEKETQEVVKEEEEKEAQKVVKEEEEKEAQKVVKEEEEKEAQKVVNEEEEKEAQKVVKEAAGSSPEPSPREAATAATAATATEAAEDGAKSRRN